MTHTPAGQTRKKVYQFVRDRILNGTPPTTREVQETFGFKAVQSARQHLQALVAEGRLIQSRGKARGYRLPEMLGLSSPTQLIPMLGRVQAGELTTAIEDPEGYIPVQTHFDHSEIFALVVRGESMVEAGILPGDIVIIRKQPTANPGEIVVALIGDEATVKTYQENNGRIELHPENDAFDPVIPREDGEHFSLLGKVIEVRRRLAIKT